MNCLSEIIMQVLIQTSLQGTSGRAFALQQPAASTMVHLYCVCPLSKVGLLCKPLLSC